MDRTLVPEPTDRRRRSIRLKGYDYAQPGTYFVTVVTLDRVCVFGDMVGGAMRLNGAGTLAQRTWEALPCRFPGIGLDAFVVMPNHIHGIVTIDQSVGVPLVGTQDDDHARMTAGAKASTRVAPTLGDVVGAYKSIVTVEYARGMKTDGWRPFRGRLWQRNYYEHIIRDENELDRAREYVVNNPLQWALDRENPAVVGRAKCTSTGDCSH